MKKKLSILMVLVTTIVMLLSGCGKTAVCSICKEEKKCETKTFFGKEVNICVDCKSK